MKKLALLFVATLILAAVMWWPTRAQDKAQDEAGVRQAIEYYFQGHATGNGEHHKKAFHPEAKLFWIRDGQLAERTSADYIAGSPGKPAPDEAQRKRSITMIDITGNAAVAKIILDYPQARLTDYMSLLKINGEWKIVNKIFVAEPKSKP
jgi:Putative lumazine-binding